MLKRQLEEWIAAAVTDECDRRGLSAAPTGLRVERSRDRAHGDFASNAALVLAGMCETPPRELARQLQARLPPSTLIERVEVAGPGFLNFFLDGRAYRDNLRTALRDGDAYGRLDLGKGRSVLLEYVSANPTGPLHVGHGRGAAYGDALARLLLAAGYRVEREYYVNDTGRQVEILALSIWLRRLEEARLPMPQFPAGAYRGEYVRTLARRLHDAPGVPRADAVRDWPADTAERSAAPDERGERDDAAVEKRLDDLLACLKTQLGEEAFGFVTRFGVDEILSDIGADLERFGATFDRWFRESALRDGCKVQRCLEDLEQNDHLYRRDGAVWFRASRFGDEKDRVLVRDNGQYTYFAADVAYHLDKYRRGYDRLIDVWGADHHGYRERLRAAVAACEKDPSRLDVRLVQFVSLYRGKERIAMSTRAGQYVTLGQLQDEVGTEAARFFYTMRRSEQHLDFDLELAKSESSDNPVYYVQYAHARICSLVRRIGETTGGSERTASGEERFELLIQEEERELMALLSRYPEVVQSAAEALEPHRVSFYLRELANHFHVYYNRHPILVEERELRAARLALCQAVAQVLRSGLSLLGIEARRRM